MLINCAKPRSLTLRPHKRFIEPEVRPVQVQVFKTQQIVFIAELMRQLEVEVASLVINPNVTTGEVMFPLLPIRAPFDLLRHLPLDAAQTGQIIPIEPRRCYLLPFIAGQKRLEAKIEAAAADVGCAWCSGTASICRFCGLLSTCLKYSFSGSSTLKPLISHC